MRPLLLITLVNKSEDGSHNMANDNQKKKEPDYLYQQGVRGIWTYRRRIPTDLLHHFDGKREIVRSTKTSDYRAALMQSHQITDHYDIPRLPENPR